MCPESKSEAEKAAERTKAQQAKTDKSVERSQFWDLDNPTALSQIADHVRDLVLPFMDRMHSCAEQILYLRERQKSPFFKEWTMLMYEAILMHENGEQAEACSKLRNWKPNRYEGGTTLDRYNEIADRLGCPKP